MEEKMRDWRKSLNSFLERYKNLLRSSFLVGSLAYQGQFGEKSDIDLVVTVRDLEDWRILCEKLDPKNKDLAQESIGVYLSGEAQSLVLNVTMEDILYQVDVMLPDFYNKAEQYLNKNQTIIYQRASNTTDYGEYIFGHVNKRITVPKPHIEKSSIVLISTPLCIVKDEFYFGVLLEKLITGYICLGGDDKQVKSFCQLGVQKMLERGNAKTIDDVIRSSVRYDRMSDEHKKSLINRYASHFCKK